MKKFFSIVLVCTLILSTFSVVLAKTPAANLPSNASVILNHDFYSHNTGTVIGSIYSADGDIRFDNSNNTVDGDIVYNSAHKFINPSNKGASISGSVMPVSDTSFDYNTNSVSVPDMPSIGSSMFGSQSYVSQSNVTVAVGWGTKGSITVSRNTYFTGTLTLHAPLFVDTTYGDVYVKINKLLVYNSGCIKVLGNNKVYILADELGSSVIINSGGDSGQVDLYLNGSNKISSGSVVCADVYADGVGKVIVDGSVSGDIFAKADYVTVDNNAEVVGDIYTKSNTSTTVSGKVTGDIITDAKDFYLTASGKAGIVGNLYALSADSISIKNDISGNVVTSAESIEITSGDGVVKGVVFAPNAQTQIHASSNKGIKGRLIADSLEIYGAGKVEYDSSAVDAFASLLVTPTVTPTVAPTVTPTVAPTVEPMTVTDLVPSNDIPSGSQIKLTTYAAYLYGYTDNWVGADMPVTRQEAAVLINRLLVQNNARGGYKKPDEPSYSDISEDDWSYSALEYMTYIGVYNPDDGTGEKRKISPAARITRGEVAKMVAFCLRLPYEDGELSFPDITKDHKFYKYIKALVDTGLWQGDNGLIKPDDFMTRAEFVAMFNRIIGRTEENGYVVSDGDCPFVWNEDGEPFLPPGSVDEAGNSIGHWAYYEITRAACSFTKSKVVDMNSREDRSKLDSQ